MTTDLQVVAGTVVIFTGAFSVLESNVPAPIDPAEVAFVFSVDGGTPTTYIYGTDAELVRTGEGNYQVSVDSGPLCETGNNAYLTGEFIGYADGDGTVQVVGYAKVLIFGAPLPNPFEA